MAAAVVGLKQPVKHRRSHSELLLAKAKLLIEQNSNDWFDFCASVGLISDNVAYMCGIQERFALYLDGAWWI